MGENEIIAQFIGWTKDDNGAWFKVIDSGNYCMNQSGEPLTFDVFWDSLIPVITYCAELGRTLQIGETFESEILQSVLDGDIHRAHHAVVTFIKAYDTCV